MNKEKVDLVDRNGVVKKLGISRLSIDLYPDLHLQIVIGVFSNNKGEYLVHQRSKEKSTEPGKIDHVCGGVMSGETPEEAVIREAKEETGLLPENLTMVHQGVNKYNRYRYLFTGEVKGEPITDPDDAEWVRFITREELFEKKANDEWEFVDEFFEDLEQTLLH